ncbi:alpha-1-antitrypsin-like [Fukomys damarensis]|uniref:alpha-1-antitrypsin-like n=1 Tax=Fukomys damarensis TaxID=885580 RepID=UPI0014559213|nr:alpha-1-antitrypsin-like [Fukomys damarensis]
MDRTFHDHEHHEFVVCHDIFYNVFDLAFAFYWEPARWSKTSNTVLSPVSIVAAFAMLSLGTKGATLTQILEGLNFNLRMISEAHVHQCFQPLLHILQHPDHQLQMIIGSSLFVSDNLMLMDQFVQGIKELYHSRVISISFRNTEHAKKKINNYVKRETHGEIANLVKNLKEDTALALVNYISFHGKWTVEFQAEYTVEEDFCVDEGTSIRVPMINRLGMFLLNREEELSSWVLVQQFARIHFPRLSISATYDLRSILSAMGITKIFSDEADLSAMTEVSSIKLSTVRSPDNSTVPSAMHKAMLTIDERRTETRGATDLGDRDWSKVPTIKFNRPFIFIIREENTNIPLFLGKVVNPIEHATCRLCSLRDGDSDSAHLQTHELALCGEKRTRRPVKLLRLLGKDKEGRKLRSHLCRFTSAMMRTDPLGDAHIRQFKALEGS